MSGASFRLEGDVALVDNLKSLHGITDPQVLRRIGIDGLEPIADAARGLVRQRTGRLANSIGTGDQLSPAQAASSQPEPGTVELYVGPGALVEAITEEFGTVHEQGHPFMRPAWDGNVGEVIRRVGAATGIELNRLTKG